MESESATCINCILVVVLTADLQRLLFSYNALVID